MGLFSKFKNANTRPSERQMLEGRYANARNNILLVVVLTVINIILLVTNSNTYFLFSAYIPFVIADLAMYLCGMYPAEIYGADYANLQFFSQEVFVIAMVIAAVILGLYVLCWVFSKKMRIGWIIAALVFFVIDTAAMLLLNGIVIDSLLDYVIHAWVIFSFVNGLMAYSKIKKLPAEDAQVFMVNGEPVAQEEQQLTE